MGSNRRPTYLVPGQDFEGGDDLVGRVRVGRLAGHEVDEGLEGDDAHPVGVHHAHDAGELALPLVAGKGTAVTATKTHTGVTHLLIKGVKKKLEV